MDVDEDDVPIRIESVTPPPLLFDDEIQLESRSPIQFEVRIRQESVPPPPLNFNNELSESCARFGKLKEREGEPGPPVREGDLEEDSEEVWEEELDESLNPTEI